MDPAARPARRAGVGTLVLAVILIAVGSYYVLRNTFGLSLPDLDSEQVVPALAVVLGLVLILRVWQDRR